MLAEQIGHLAQGNSLKIILSERDHIKIAKYMVLSELNSRLSSAAEFCEPTLAVDLEFGRL